MKASHIIRRLGAALYRVTPTDGRKPITIEIPPELLSLEGAAQAAAIVSLAEGRAKR